MGPREIAGLVVLAHFHLAKQSGYD